MRILEGNCVQNICFIVFTTMLLVYKNLGLVWYCYMLSGGEIHDVIVQRYCVVWFKQFRKGKNITAVVKIRSLACKNHT